MKINFTFILLLLLLLSCSTIKNKRTPASLVAYDCQKILQELLNNNGTENKIEFFQSLDQKMAPDQSKSLEQLLHWLGDITNLSEYHTIRKNLESLLFIDYRSSVNELIKINKRRVDLKNSWMFNLYGSSFSTFESANKYLLEQKPPQNIETLKRLHSIFMSGGSDQLSIKYRGQIRDVDIFGNVPSIFAIDQKQYDELNKNPYISIQGLTSSFSGNYYIGQFEYPSIDNLSDRLKAKLQKIDPILAKKVELYKKERIGQREDLTEKFVSALTENLLSWFIKQKGDLGEINTPAKFFKFIQIIAVAQKTLISIHPFRDGNGRTIREFIVYYSFIEKGFPPPRLIDTDVDLYASIPEMIEQLIAGSLNTFRLYEGLKERLKNGLSLGSTPELLLPYIPNSLSISLKKQKPAEIIHDSRKIPVNGSELAEYFKIRMENKELQAKFKSWPIATYEQILADYETFFKQNNLDYIHEKMGEERLSLHLIDQDFLQLFANSSYKNKTSWKAKMDQWYSEDIIWRGLSRTNVAIEESEILSMFSTINPQFVSNYIASKMGPNVKQDELLRLVFQDFNRYNHGLIDGGLEKMASDQSEVGPNYQTSYAYSTSKKREVAKAYAMGAMVVAPYGEQMNYQHLLKSRVIGGMRRANKDVDLGRLKQLRPDFSYHYGRQQEVMGIGAADPDALMFVQLIDEKGDVIKSYVRNPQKPSQILIYDKEVSQFDSLPKDYVRTYDLP